MTAKRNYSNEAEYMIRSVFHIRLSDFELQAERMLDASLRTRAVAIISSHHQNGTVVALSNEAREEGLWPGMKVSLVRKMMSHSVQLLPYNAVLYDKMNRYLYRIVSSFSPIVEPDVYGQFFMDMTGADRLYQDSLRAGNLITRDIQFKLNLESLVGISGNKLVSRISTAVVPERIHMVTKGEEPCFLAPLASPILPSVQEKAVRRMVDFLFLHRVRDVQGVVADSHIASVLFGLYSKRISMESRGEDTSVVKPPRLRDHITEQKVLAVDTNDEGILRGVVRSLAEQVAFQLRQRRQVARSVTVEIHYTDGFKNSRKGSVSRNDDETVRRTCVDLLSRAKTRRNRVRSILVDATHLKPLSDQLELFDSTPEDDLHLARAMDQIREKYGFNSIQSCAMSYA